MGCAFLFSLLVRMHINHQITDNFVTITAVLCTVFRKCLRSSGKKSYIETIATSDKGNTLSSRRHSARTLHILEVFV
jgi:hypothetical protein